MNKINESYFIYDLADAYKEIDYIAKVSGWDMYFVNDTLLRIYSEKQNILIEIFYEEKKNFDAYQSKFTVIDGQGKTIEFNAKDDFFQMLNYVKSYIFLYK